MAEDITATHLASVVESVRSETPPSSRQGPYMVVTGISDQGEPTSKEHSADQGRRAKKLQDALTILWASVDFWKLISEGEGGHTLRLKVGEESGIWLPDFSAAIWKALAKATSARAELFQVLVLQTWRMEPPTGFIADASEKQLVALFKLSLRSRIFNLTPEIKASGLSRDSLKLLYDSARGLAEDAAWGMAHPDETPTTAIRKRSGGRPQSLEHALKVEAMVSLLKKRPKASDMEIAVAYLKEHDPQKWKMNSDRERRGTKLKDPLQTLRKDAGIARRLVKLRDKVPVAHYVNAQGKARNPPRRSSLGK